MSASVQDVFDSTDLVRLLLSHVSDVEVIGRAATTCHTLRTHAFSDEVMRPVTQTMEPRLVCGATINKDVFSAVCSRAKHRPWWVKAAALCSDTCPSCKQWGARPPLAQVPTAAGSGVRWLRRNLLPGARCKPSMPHAL